MAAPTRGLEVVTAVAGLPAVRRRSGQAASAGAALLAARATGSGYELDRMDPVTDTVVPDPATVAVYAASARRPPTPPPGPSSISETTGDGGRPVMAVVR